MSVAAVVLAAGASTRLGRPKQTVELGGETLLERALRVAREAGCDPVIVVVNRDLGDGFRNCVVVLNENATEGLASSIRCGVGKAQELNAQGVVAMTCDQPGVRPEHLVALMAEPAVMTGSAYSGRVGVPAYFPAAVFGALMQLRGDAGARELLRAARSVVQEELGLDIDTDEDLTRARILFES